MLWFMVSVFSINKYGADVFVAVLPIKCASRVSPKQRERNTWKARAHVTSACMKHIIYAHVFFYVLTIWAPPISAVHNIVTIHSDNCSQPHCEHTHWNFCSGLCERVCLRSIRFATFMHDSIQPYLLYVWYVYVMLRIIVYAIARFMVLRCSIHNILPIRHMHATKPTDRQTAYAHRHTNSSQTATAASTIRTGLRTYAVVELLTWKKSENRNRGIIDIVIGLWTNLPASLLVII